MYKKIHVSLLWLFSSVDMVNMYGVYYEVRITRNEQEGICFMWSEIMDLIQIVNDGFPVVVVKKDSNRS